MRQKVDGYTFNTRAAANRYLALKNMRDRGEIKEVVVQPTFVLVKAYRKCPCCGVLSDNQVCELCETETYASGGITYYADFLVNKNDGSAVIEDVWKSLGTLSHEFNMKMILYDQIYATPIRIVVDGVPYRKTSKGWVQGDSMQKPKEAERRERR